MNLLFVSPNADYLITKPLQQELSQVGNLVYIHNLSGFNRSLKKLDHEPTILALDPDSCDWHLPDEYISSIPLLQAICLQTTSFDWLNTKLAAQKGIPVVNILDWCTESTAEWAIYLAKNIARSIPLTSFKMTKAEQMVIPRIEMYGKTAGIIGLGKIGTRIAELCQLQGMKIIYWSKNSLDSRFFRVSLNHLFKNADFIFPALEAKPETSNIITQKDLSLMKPSASLVSIWPQKKLFDHRYILSQSKNQKIFGYAFEDNDFKGEKYPGNVYATQPIGWATQDSAARNAQKWVENIILAAQGKYPNQIN